MMPLRLAEVHVAESLPLDKGRLHLLLRVEVFILCRQRRRRNVR